MPKLVKYHASPTFTKFHNDDKYLRIVIGPVGCVAGETKIITERGVLPISEITQPMRVLSYNERTHQFELALSGGAFPKGRDYLYRIRTQRGEFVASGHHLVYVSPNKYQRVDTLCQGQTLRLCSSDLPQTSCASCQRLSHVNARHYSQIDVDYLGGYARLARQYGQQLLEETNDGQSFSPLQGDVRRCTQCCACKDDCSEQELKRSRHGQSCAHTCIGGSCCRAEPLGLGEGRCISAKSFGRGEDLTQSCGQSQKMCGSRQINQQPACACLSQHTPIYECPIISIKREKIKRVYWDMQVLDNNNYVTVDGTIHHNSGKSVGCCWEVMFRAMEMPPDSSGLRRSRWLIVRNTSPELETTTMRTWKDWFGPQVFDGARISGRPPYTQTISFPSPKNDNTQVELEVLFLAMDGEDDIKKLMSLECSGIFFNELRYIEHSIFQASFTRPGRYPRKEEVGDYWHGIIADTNPPDDSHWIYKLAEENLPDNASVYYQPSGLSPNAENLEHLPESYYQNMMIGKPEEWINVYVHGKYGFMQDGKAVYSDTWNDDFHYKGEIVKLIPNQTLMGGIDASGRSPAAVVIQTTAKGQMQVLWELCGEDVGAVSFSKLLRQEVSKEFPFHNITWYGDPAGAYKTQTDERTYFDILHGEGIRVQPSPGFRPSERIEAVSSALSRNIGGEPALLVTKGAKTLRKGFNGGYRYKKIGRSGSARFTSDPEKNEYSHVHDALQYVISATGELNRMKARENKNYKTYDYATDW